MKTGIELIAAERARQMQVEGWTSEHDDAQERGELALAGACYAAAWSSDETNIRLDIAHRVVGPLWPWSFDWWKPTSRIKCLVKSGALIAAEIDRLQRKGECL